MNNQVAVTQKPAGARRTDPFPRLWDWFENMIPMEQVWRDTTARAIKVEEFVQDGQFVVRAELPGVDPGKDIEVTVGDGRLTIRGERREEVKEDQRSEFYYGSFVRSLTLPTGVDATAVVAEYKDGMLDVRMPLPMPSTEPTKVAVTRPEQG
jgi:HSP20 family protein